MFRISTKEKFNDKNPSVKRLRFRFHWRLLRKFAKKSRNPLPPQTQINGTTEPSGVNDDGSRFPGKSIAFRSLSEALRRTFSPIDFSMGKDFPKAISFHV